MKLTGVVRGWPLRRPRVVSSRTHRERSSSANGPAYIARGTRSSARENPVGGGRLKVGSLITARRGQARTSKNASSRTPGSAWSPFASGTAPWRDQEPPSSAVRALGRLARNPAQTKQLLLATAEDETLPARGTAQSLVVNHSLSHDGPACYQMGIARPNPSIPIRDAGRLTPYAGTPTGRSTWVAASAASTIA